MTVAFLACASAFAFFQVPHVAMLAELTDDYDERTRLMAGRIAVLAVAILVSGVGAPLVRDLAGYPAMGVAVGVLIALGTVGGPVPVGARRRAERDRHRPLAAVQQCASPDR